LIDWAPGFVRTAARDVFDLTFDALTWLLAAPLQALRFIAGWVHDVLTGQIGSGIVSRSALEDAVRQKIHSIAASDLTIDLSLDLGPAGKWALGGVTIGAGAVVAALADVTIGSEPFGAAVAAVVGSAGVLRATQAQQQATQGALDGAVKQADAQAAMSTLTTGRALQISVTPANRSVHEGRAVIRVRVDGANRTFVD